jgi:peroxiredoxin-like protein
MACLSGGPGHVWSPEHLFVAAVASCLMTTFRAIAARSGVEVLDYSDEASGHLVRGEDGLYSIESITLRPTIVISEDSKLDRAERLIEKAERACLISRSINSEVKLEAKILQTHQVGT